MSNDLVSNDKAVSPNEKCRSTESDTNQCNSFQTKWQLLSSDWILEEMTIFSKNHVGRKHQKGPIPKSATPWTPSSILADCKSPSSWHLHLRHRSPTSAIAHHPTEVGLPRVSSSLAKASLAVDVSPSEIRGVRFPWPKMLVNYLGSRCAQKEMKSKMKAPTRHLFKFHWAATYSRWVTNMCSQPYEASQ